MTQSSGPDQYPQPLPQPNRGAMRSRRPTTVGIGTAVAILSACLASCGGSAANPKSNVRDDGPKSESTISTDENPSGPNSEPHGLALFDCDASLSIGAKVGFADASTGQSTETYSLPRALGDGSVQNGEPKVTFPGAVLKCGNGPGVEGTVMQHSVRAIFDDMFSKAAITIELLEPDTDHVGYIDLETGSATDLSASRVKAAFGDKTLFETGAAFGPQDNLLFSREAPKQDLATKLYAQPINGTPSAYASAYDNTDVGLGRSLSANHQFIEPIVLGGANRSIVIPAFKDYPQDNVPWIPSRFGRKSIRGSSVGDDCRLDDCVYLAKPEQVLSDAAQPLSVRPNHSITGCVPLLWTSQDSIVCASEVSPDGNDAVQQLTTGTIHADIDELRITPLTVSSPRELGNAVLSPDGERIAFVAGDTDGKTIYTAPVHGSAPVEPTMVGPLDKHTILIDWK